MTFNLLVRIWRYDITIINLKAGKPKQRIAQYPVTKCFLHKVSPEVKSKYIISGR